MIWEVTCCGAWMGHNHLAKLVKVHQSCFPQYRQTLVLCAPGRSLSILKLWVHIIAMSGQGFFIGKLINRFGAMRIAAAGLLITACSVLAGLGGTDIIHFWLSLILLGLGWNFGFTGASAKIIEYHRPEEKTQVQSLNDFVVFGVMIIGSFSSGALLSLYGRNAVLWGSLVPVGLAFLGIVKELQAKKRDELSF